MKEDGLHSVLMADDDEDDCVLASSAFREAGVAGKLRLVADGKELMAYLRREDSFSDPEQFPRPGIILLDLNVPRKDGREALAEVKSDPELNSIPVVILTTSQEERDIELCMRLGAASFITNPTDFEEWVEMVETLEDYIQG